MAIAAWSAKAAPTILSLMPFLLPDMRKAIARSTTIPSNPIKFSDMLHPASFLVF
jgi:hypothetical protein